MGLVTVGGADVIQGRIHMHLRGAWWGDFKLEGGNAPTGSVQVVAANGLTLTGFVRSSGSFLNQSHVKVIGGAGGLIKAVPPKSFQNAQLRDPLSVVMSASGETLSSTIASSVLSASLPAWSIFQAHAGQVLEELCFAAASALGVPVNWRVLADGTIWIGTETFPPATLPDPDDVVDQFPAGGRFVLAVVTPSLLPGVFLTDIGANVLGVDHWIEAEQVQTWAWSSLAA